MNVWMITDEHGEFVRFEEAPELELASLHEGHTARVVHLPSAASPILLVRRCCLHCPRRFWTFGGLMKHVWRCHPYTGEPA